jgi:small ligand-binding sensory domain FIST
MPGLENLGFLYAADGLAPDLAKVVHFFSERTGIAHWIGTVGSGILSMGREVYDTPSLAVMLGSFPHDSFRLMPSATTSCEGFLAATRTWRQRHASHFAILHGDPRNASVPLLIGQLAEGLENGFLVGGLTSSNGEHRQIADQVTEGGLSGALFSGEVPFVTGLTQGCALIGRPHEVTECQGNIIIRIDGRPALDVFRETIGEVLARNLNRVAGYIFVALPVPGSDTADYLVRNLVGIDPQRRLLAVGHLISAGDIIQFARRDGNTARQDLVRMLQSVKRRAGTTPRGGLYYTCLGRGRYLFGENSEELRIVQRELGDFPLVGFFANGEISRNQLYGYTGVLALFL